MLTEMAQVSKERKYLLTLVKKYAVGQGIAIRLSKQIKKSNQKLQSAVRKYNGHVEDESATLSFDDVKEPDSPLWDGIVSPLIDQVPATTKRELITNYFKCERAKEEVVLCKQEMKSTLKYFHSQRGLLIDLLNNIHDKLESEYDVGCAGLLAYKIKCIGRAIAKLTASFCQFVELDDDDDLGMHITADYHVEELDETDPLLQELSLYFEEENEIDSSSDDDVIDDSSSDESPDEL